MKKLFIGLFAVILLSAVLSAMYLFSTVEKPETILVNGTNTNPVSYTDSNFLAKLKSAYPTVYRILDNDEIKAGYVIPGLEQSQAIYHTGQNKGKLGISKEMDPQGMAIIDDKYIAISAYSRGKIFNSVIWLIDKVSGHYIKTIALDAAYHVGGITYDEDKHQLWIATVDDEGRAQIKSLKFETIEAYNLNTSKQPIVFDYSDDLGDIRLTSYLTYHNGTIYAGYFDENAKGVLAAYPLNEEGNLIRNSNSPTVEPSRTWAVPEQIQCISFYKNFILLSQSYGNKPSQLYIYEDDITGSDFKFDHANIVTKLELPPYLEQIVGDNGDVLLLFESATAKYRQNPFIFSIDRILKIKVDEMNDK